MPDPAHGTLLDAAASRWLLPTTNTHQAKDAIDRALNPDPQTPITRRPQPAANSPSGSPRFARSPCPSAWTSGGVQVPAAGDMRAAIANGRKASRGHSLALRDKNVRHAGLAREGDNIVIRVRDAETRYKASRDRGEHNRTSGSPMPAWGASCPLRHDPPEAQKRTQECALKQNSRLCTTASTSWGSRPVIQQQGSTASCAAPRRAGNRQGQDSSAHRDLECAWWTRTT